jgi:type II secretory pathway pseudopilin PulG
LRRAQQGALGAIVIVILAILLTAFVAAYALTRMKSGNESTTDTGTALAAAAEALDQFASAQKRLPCPADPAMATGLEVLPAPGAATCSFPGGTLPWQTLGLKVEAGYDAWGRKISYRVYTGNKGSLTQPNGINMVECDLEQATPGSTTATAGSAGGLCVSSADPLLRSTRADTFLQGKGLALKEFGVDRDYVAYVLVSHGVSGLGGYTASGARLDLPMGVERNNTDDNGPFTIKAFSDPDTAVANAQHFDDLIVYRTLPDLVKRAGLSARDWPEAAVVSSSALLNATTAATALGQPSVAPGDLGVSALAISGVQVSGFSSTGTATNLTLDSTTLLDGTVAEGFGIAGNFTNRITNFGNEYLKAQFPAASTRFAVVLADFGKYSILGLTFTEKVEFRFFSGATQVDSIVKAGCSVDGGLAGFYMTTSAFDSVEIRPQAATTATSTTGFTELLVSEVMACAAAAPSCTTSLSSVASACP